MGKADDAMRKAGDRITAEQKRSSNGGAAKHSGGRAPSFNRAPTENTPGLASEDYATAAEYAQHGAGAGVRKLYEKMKKVKPGDEEELSVNALDDYMDVTYGIALSLVDSGPGSSSTYEDLLGKEKNCFASSGSVMDSFDNLYGINSLDVKTVCSVTAANPEFAYSIEFKLELTEPHGLSFDKNIRQVASDLSYGDGNPAFYIWRLDLWWSGFNATTGEWTEKIPFNGYRGEKVDMVTHFCHLISLDASVTSFGTTYGLSMVPSAFAASTRSETIITDSIQLELNKNKIEETLLGNIFSTLSDKLTERSRFKEGDNHYEIHLPEELFNTIVAPEGESGEGGWANSADKIIFNAPGNSSIFTLIMNILSGSPEIRACGADAEVRGGLPNAPNLSFVIYPEVNYDTAYHDAKSNTYKGVRYIYKITPYFEWKSAIPRGNADARLDEYARRNLRRVYNYMWTSENTEVISIDTKLKVFYFINQGYGGLNNQAHHDDTGYVSDGNTPDKASEKYNQRKEDFKNRDQGRFPGGQGGSNAPSRSGPSNIERNTAGAENAPSGSPLADGGIETSDYGVRRDPFRQPKKEFHNGIDLRARPGTPVYATQDGIVETAAYGGNYGRGNNVKIDGGRYDTRYQHLRDITVRRGQRVKKGDLIGYSGNTGRSTAPHLHYEVYDEQGGDPGGRFHSVDPDRFGGSRKSGSGGQGGEDVASQGSSNSGMFGDGSGPAYGRNVVFSSSSNLVGATPYTTDSITEDYQLAFERRVGYDLVKLENMQVRGDPRWMLGSEQLRSYNVISALIRINMFEPDQSEYMSTNSGKRQSDLSLGGYYELISIDHHFKDGGFTQSLNGYRVLGLNK